MLLLSLLIATSSHAAPMKCLHELQVQAVAEGKFNYINMAYNRMPSPADRQLVPMIQGAARVYAVATRDVELCMRRN